MTPTTKNSAAAKRSAKKPAAGQATAQEEAPAPKPAAKKKARAAKPAAKRRASRSMPADSVRIRTYRQGLGDCFLLTFFDGSTTTNILVDCGVLLGTANANDVMNNVVSDIIATTGNHLDVVVATHEHWDHVSGFNQARERFAQMTIDQIWMAWTENLKDQQAGDLRAEREDRKQALAASLAVWTQRLQANPTQVTARTTARHEAARQLLGFFGGDLAAALGRSKTSDAMDYLRDHSAPKTYLEPGDVKTVPGQPDRQVFVLGPPRDLKWLKKERPSKRNPETYTGDDHALTMVDSFLAAVHSQAGADPTPADDLAFPFDESYRKPVSQASADSLYSQSYVAGDDWRKIDIEWLGSTSDLALSLDSDTNNTSLVLAFELGAGGQILLFPGDAQVGNWLSWQDVTWSDRAAVTATELLGRTTYYKVAHHGSHNATLRELGLELMTDTKLMAMVPTNRQMAEQQAWAMPFEPLWDRLVERCAGRVLRSDEGGPNAVLIAGLSSDDRAAYEETITDVTDLYVDVTIIPSA